MTQSEAPYGAPAPGADAAPVRGRSQPGAYEAGPDLLETVAAQVRHAVRQIDAALVDTRLNDMGRLYLRKVRGTLLASEDAGDIWPEGQWDATRPDGSHDGCQTVRLPRVSDQPWCHTHNAFVADANGTSRQDGAT